MTLEQLRIFVAVAERLHMTRAAQALGLTQSAVSAAVATLEQQHDVRLFNRVGRGLELSAAGAVFLGEARAVLGRAQAAQDALGDLAGLKRGSVCVAASQTVANYWLPGRLADFASRHAGVSVRLVVANTAHAAQMALEGLVDFSLVEGPITDLRLSLTDIGGDSLSVYGGFGHPLADRKSVSVDDLQRATWVLREPGSGTRSELETALRARGLEVQNLAVLLELPSNEAVLGAVAVDGLLTVVSDLAAAPHLAAGHLVRIGRPLTGRRFSLVSHVDRAISQAGKALIASFGSN